MTLRISPIFKGLARMTTKGLAVDLLERATSAPPISGELYSVRFPIGRPD